MKKLLLACMLALGLGASAQITVSESFEGTALPTGWTSSASTFQGFDTNAGTPCAGAKSIRYNLYSGATSWNVVYTSTASNGLAMNYSFSYLAKGYSTTGAIKGSVKAEYSVGNSSTWVELGTTVPLDSPNSTPIPCATLSGTIPAGTIPAGASFKFRLTGNQTTGGDFYIGFDDVKLIQETTTPPACTALVSPANAATAVSLTPTITWNVANGASSYLLSIGTTAGGTDVVNNQDVGNVTSYAIPAGTPLNYVTNYYVTVTPKNNLGSATACNSSMFTTRNIACPSVSALSSATATGVSITPTITWGAVSEATGYKISIGTTAGGTDVLNNFDVGNATTYTHNTPLGHATKYYYTVNSYNVSAASSSCTERNFTTITLCPAVSTPSSSSATGVSINPAFAWTAVPGATGYKISIGTTAGGTDVLNASDLGNVTSYTHNTALNYNTKYYYTIFGYSATQTGVGCTERNFTTVTLCPSISAPSSAATGVSTTPTFTWTAVPGATGYKISIGTTAGGTDILNNSDVGNVTTYTHNTVLNFNTKYFYTISGYTPTQTGTSCTERNFTTSTLCPSVSAPSSSATGVSTTPTFTWTAIPNISGYKISIGTTAGGTDILNAFDLGNVTTYTHNTALNYNTKYYYTISGYSATQTTTGCTERNFTTMPLCPSVTVPSNTATNVSITPTFVWNAVSGATGYRISIGTTAGGTDIMNNVDLGNVLSYTLQSPLAFTTKYYYTVNGYNGGLSSTGCSERTLTTQGACPVVTYPSDAATLQPVMPVIKWNAIATAISYTLTVGTTAGGSDIMNNVDIGNVTSYTFATPLTLGTKYYYKVNSNTSTACTERSFTVNTVAAPANDDCSGALVASSFPYNYSQTDGAGSTNGNGFITSCSGGSNDGMWFKFIGDGGNITVKATSTSSWDHKVSVYSGTCGSLTCVGSVDDALSSSGNSETYTFSSVAGTQYFVNVAYYSGTSDSAEGNFNLNITTTAILGTSDVQPSKAKEGIKAYPNPFVDDLNISDISNVKSIVIIDLSGKLVKTIDKPASILHLGDLKQGMYLVSLNMNDGSRQVIKVIKR